MQPAELLQLKYSDGYEAFARLWRPAALRGAVLYFHGIQSHGLWFEASASRLAEAGFAVLLPDRRGSGRNERERGHAPSVHRLLQDISEALDELHVRTGYAQFHLVGVSWGSKQALAGYRYAASRVQSLTLIGPGLFPKVDIPLSSKVKVGLSAIALRPTLFDIPLNDPKLFTTNPERQRFIAADPLALRQVTAQFLLTSRKLDRYIQGLTEDKTGVPLRVFLAGEDRIVDNHRTREFVRRLHWPKRGITEYRHAHHTLEFEANPEPFFKDLVEWLTRCCE